MASPTNPNWPLIVTQVGLDQDPFNASAPAPTFADISLRVQDVDDAAGRQYETDLIQAGETTLTVLDPDEAFNPTNPGSPYYPNVKVYRPIIEQAMWPPAPVGSATNLLWGQGVDPGFESYAANTQPSWITAVGSSNPHVGTTYAYEGSQDLKLSIPAGSSPVGVSWPVTCIPGQLYTSSVWTLKNDSNTYQISVDSGVINTNPFFSTGDASGWAGSGGATIAVAQTTSYSGPYAAIVTATGAANPGIITAAAYAVPVVAGASYVVTASLVISVTTGAQVMATWRDNTGATISTSTGFNYGFTGGVWRTISGTFTAPAGAVSVLVGVQDPGTPTAGTQLTVASVTIDPTGSVLGTSTAVSSSYQRLTVTWTATRTSHVVTWASTGTTAASSATLDALQHEPGGSATAYAASGPTIYPLYSKLVERWPSTWLYQGLYGLAQITAVDMFAVLANRLLWTEYRNAVLAKAPAFYWPLSEPSGATSYAEVSGNQGPALTPKSGKYGGQTVTPGQSTGLAGDPGGDAVAIGYTDANPAPVTTLQAGAFNTPGPVIGGSLPITVSLSVWMTHNSATNTNSGFPVSYGDLTTVLTPIYIETSSPGAKIDFVAVSRENVAAGIQIADNWADGKWHHYAAVATLSSTQVTIQAWVDGASVGTATTAGTLGANQTSNTIEVGGYITEYGDCQSGASGQAFAHLALWNRALTSAEVSDLYNAGKNAYSGEGSGARIARYLGYAGVGDTAIDTGQTTMGASALSAGTATLDACNAVAVSENGRLFIDPTGTATFWARTRRYLNTTATWVFGENQAAGELPYGADIAFDYDPTRVFNAVTVQRAGGINAVGGTPSAIAASQNAYGTRSLAIDSGGNSDLEAQDYANWEFAVHQNPRQRVNTLTINPAANPALWPCALGAKQGDRVTVKRRTLPGYVMTADYYIERIERQRKPNQFTVTFQLSPATGTTPWILGDATYGVLDSTTVLGF